MCHSEECNDEESLMSSVIFTDAISNSLRAIGILRYAQNDTLFTIMLTITEFPELLSDFEGSDEEHYQLLRSSLAKMCFVIVTTQPSKAVITNF